MPSFTIYISKELFMRIKTIVKILYGSDEDKYIREFIEKAIIEYLQQVEVKIREKLRNK